jgi:succinate dehydrogenase/fumarate reductase flavoprotein subunit
MAAEIVAVSDPRSVSAAGEHKLSADVARRAHAEALLQNEILQEAFVQLEERYIEEWRVSQFRDTDARERLWQAVNILRKVKDHLAKIVRDGKLAQREIEQLAEKRKRFGIV